MERKVKELRLRKLIDKLGETKQKIEKLQRNYELLRREIITLCEELGVDTASGERFSITITPNTKMVVHPEKLYTVLPEDQFFKVISVHVTKLDKYIPRHKVADIAEFRTEGYRVYVKERVS